MKFLSLTSLPSGGNVIEKNPTGNGWKTASLVLTFSSLAANSLMYHCEREAPFISKIPHVTTLFQMSKSISVVCDGVGTSLLDVYYKDGFRVHGGKFLRHCWLNY